ncbi:PREDICTED: 15.4 kDa class V heat shock protein [Ipomoea nil]|uniref:15.4 kDa class V heat shock protein n=1 Tax=Ipomoea nil TaxID=35883 RepID=UPI000901A525|nr:PREDICTED: 15.4 kDa class V heat shock protein [Ipomoea nil]
MEFPAGFHDPSSWHSFFNYHLLSPHHFLPENHVHWRETPESHIYSADLPGVEKEKIRVEVEDSRYLIIRTEGGNDDESMPATRSFMRKFRLPGMVDVDGISAGYRDGVLTVTVPRSFVRRRGVLLINPTEILDRVSFGASAA